MSAEELGCWIAYFDTQPYGAKALEEAMSLLLAAVHNGPVQRKDKRNWRPSDFYSADKWAPPKPPGQARKGGPTLAQLKARFGRKR